MLTRLALIVTAIAGLIAAQAVTSDSKTSESSTMKKLTPIVFVDDIESSLPFWVDKLGYKVTLQVPESEAGPKLGFVALTAGGVEIMLQTYPALQAELPDLMDQAKSSKPFFFLEVESIETIEKALAGETPVSPKRQTFYGSTEIVYRSPGGAIVTFAQMSSD